MSEIPSLLFYILFLYCIVIVAFSTMGTNGGMQQISNSSVNDTYIALNHNLPDSTSPIQIPRQDCMSKEYVSNKINFI